MKKRLLAAAVAGAVMLSAGAQAQDTAAPEGPCKPLMDWSEAMMFG